jgi:hypothetical protein
MKLLNTFNKSLQNLNLGAFLHNRYLLYILCILAIVNIVLLGNKRDYNSIIVFVVVSLLTSYFNKNMIVILSVGLLAVYALNYKKSHKEGVENQGDAGTAAGEEGEGSTSEEEPDKDIVPTTTTKEDKPLESTSTDRQALYNNLTNDFKEFQDVQKNLLATMKQIDPLLQQAEGFVSKFEDYKKKAQDLKKK